MTGTNDTDGPRNRTDGDHRGRRQFLKGAGTGAAAAVLAGCSWIQGDGSGDATSSGTGTGSGTPDLSGETLRVGVLALAPDGNPLGEGMVNGAKLAARQLSGEGVLGADVEVVPADTQGSPGTAIQEYRRLTREERVDLTTGVFLDQVLGGLLPRIAQSETLHFTTAAIGLNPAKRIAEDYERFKYHFRPGPMNVAQIADAQLAFLEQHADRLGWKSAALVVEDLGEFDPFYERVKANAGNHLDVAVDGRTATDLRDWRPVFDNVEEAGADLMLVGQSISGVAAVKIWGQQKRPFEYGGLHVPSQIDSFWQEVNGVCEHVFTMTAVTPRSENTSRTQEFMQAYRDAFGNTPGYVGPTTYDAVLMYADAVRETGSTDPEQLIPYLEDRTFTDGVLAPEHEFQGPDAEFPHDPAPGPLQESGLPLWHQWQERNGEGVQAVFAPEQHKMADYRKPPWIQ